MGLEEFYSYKQSQQFKAYLKHRTRTVALGQQKKRLMHRMLPLKHI